MQIAPASESENTAHRNQLLHKICDFEPGNNPALQKLATVLQTLLRDRASGALPWDLINRVATEYEAITKTSGRAVDWSETVPGKRIVGFGGAFSAGKSSLINALLPSRQLATEVSPTTSVPTCLLKADGDSYRVLSRFNNQVALSHEDFLSLTHDEEERHGSRIASLLQAAFVSRQDFPFENLALLDTPGYSKPDTPDADTQSDAEIARKQLNAAHFVIWVISAENGVISEKDLCFLQSLRPGIPLLLVISRADKRPAQDIAAITDRVRQTLDERKLTLLDVIAYSNRGKNYPIDSIHRYINQWNGISMSLPDAALSTYLQSGALDPVDTERPTRIRALIAAISEGMFEREEIISVALLGALSGQNTFLYGPPGTAKSLISRRISCAFKQPKYFEYLMNRFSTPEEVFGPVSIKALKEDQYTRKTDSYLPKAEFAFLDEIWKSSPAILNTLLTLINERVFRNGEAVESAPLKALIAASNETPDANQGLEALYDRFIVRLMVGPIEQHDNFERLLCSKPTQAEIAVADDLAVNSDEWNQWREELHQVRLSPETLSIIRLIRAELSERSKELNVYVSDRRWQRAAALMKASAFFNGRKTTNHSDALLLSYCLWTEKSNRETVRDLVEEAINKAGFDIGLDLGLIDEQLADIEQATQTFIEQDSESLDAVTDDSDYFQVPFDRSVDGFTESIICIPKDKVGSSEPFSPFKLSALDGGAGRILKSLICTYNEDGSFTIRKSDGSAFEPPSMARPFLRRTLSDLNSEYELKTEPLVSRRQITEEEKEQLATIRQTLLDKAEEYTVHLSQLQATPANCFLSTDKHKQLLASAEEQLDQIRLKIKECERLEDLCQ